MCKNIKSLTQFIILAIDFFIFYQFPSKIETIFSRINQFLKTALIFLQHIILAQDLQTASKLNNPPNLKSNSRNLSFE